MKMSSTVYSGNVHLPINFVPRMIDGGLAKEQKKNKYQSIAPAPTTTTMTILGMNGINTQNFGRKVYTPRKHGAPYSVDQTQSVQRRNARERNRVKQVNNSFAKLRQHIPQSIIADLTKGGGRGPHKKISKVDTLRIAVEYIRRLHDLVEELNGSYSETASNSSYSTVDTEIQTPPTNQYSSDYHQQQQQQIITKDAKMITPNSYLSPAEETTGCISPTSSFSSNTSFDSGTYEPVVHHIPTSTSTMIESHLQLKYEPYDKFSLSGDDCTPDDEEILDYISLWQEQ